MFSSKTTVIQKGETVTKRFLWLALFLLPISAFAQSPGVHLSGIITDTSGNPNAGTVTIILGNYGANAPVITGYSELAPISVSVTANGSGVWSASVYGEDQINPINTTLTVQITPAGSNAVLWIAEYVIKSGTYDLSNLIPVGTTIPPQFIPANIGPLVTGCTTTGGLAYQNGTSNTLTCNPSVVWVQSGNTGTQTLANTTPATNSANQSSPQLCFQGSNWTGSLSQTDTWCFQNVPGSGANPPQVLTLTHFGAGTVSNTINIPYVLNVGGPSTGITGTLGMFGSTSGYAGWTTAGVAGNPGLTAMPVSAPASSGLFMGESAGSPTSTAWKPIGEYCGATSGGTQACAQTVQFPIIIHGEVTLNTATTQSITTLPFTDGTFSCSGSDLTTPAGTVSFANYLAASVTIQETGGVNTDHLRYICAGF